MASNETESSNSNCKKKLSLVFLFIITILLAGITIKHLFFGNTPLQTEYTTPNLNKDNEDFYRSSIRNINYRLPTNLSPSYYRISLIPNLEEGPNQFEVPGEVTITVECKTNTNTAVLHSLRSTYEQFRITNRATGVETPVINHVLNIENETISLNLGSNLIAGQEYLFYFKYKTEVSQELFGLYRSSYINPTTNQTHWMAATQFQIGHARKVFPCFDEPNYKAIFEISLGRNERHSTLCNMDLNRTEPIDGQPGWFWDHYNPTVKMSTYIIAIIVSDFDHAEPVYSNKGVLIKSWARPQIAKEEGVYATDVNKRILEYFEELFDEDYPLKKLDSIAPPDFPYGAMENWGLVLYLESLLLWKEGVTTENSRKSITSVIGHELAHKWFGNIVTTDWWDMQWLNEGFAAYVASLGMHFAQPEFEGNNSIVTDSIQPSMRDNSNPDNEWSIIDGEYARGGNLYHRGGSFLRMMEAFLTHDTFIKGIRNYIDENLYGNVVQDDLFRIMNAQAQLDNVLPNNLTVKLIMDTWTRKPGFPIIRVTAVGTGFVISQEKCIDYKMNLIENSNTIRKPNIKNEDELWYIPISYATEDNPDFGPANTFPKFWMNKDSPMEFFQMDVDTSKWVVFNPDTRHYYRVWYHEDSRKLIKAQLDTDANVFTAASKSQLMDDYFYFAFNLYEGVEEALEFTSFLNQETNLHVWIPTLNRLRKAYNIFTGKTSFVSFSNYFVPKLEGALNGIGLEQTPDKKGTNVILRVQLLDWACGMGSQICYDYANRLIGSGETVPVDIRQVIYCGYVASNSETGFNYALEKYISGDERILWRNAMACTQEEALVNRLLDLSIEENSDILKSDVQPLWASISQNGYGKRVILNFVAENLNQIINYFDDLGIITNTVRIFCDYSSTSQEIAEVDNLLDSDVDGQLTPIHEALQTYRNNLLLNIQWMNLFGNSMVNWFNANTI